MGNRLSKIYTRTGDGGDTGLGDGRRVAKDNVRVEAFGTVDELNSVMGLLITHAMPEAYLHQLIEIQHDLFDLGGELCIPGHQMIHQGHVERLEQFLDGMNADLEPVKEFVLPGGVAAAAVAHLARTVCRRAERRLVALAGDEDVNTAALGYLNRLSDVLFVLARRLNREAGRDDVLWRRDRGQ